MYLEDQEHARLVVEESKHAQHVGVSLVYQQTNETSDDDVGRR